ncbi:hypothetical protein [Micromonospora sp. NPDC051006]|uniref:hypothetical protein n=1 Tax=Micromonospora sp. NPDC051006 TaxID=3364283 RepID=UPI0037A56468
MWEKVDVPCVGGPANGRSLLVPVDEGGVPPDVIDQNWLWVEFGGELPDAEMASSSAFVSLVVSFVGVRGNCR